MAALYRILLSSEEQQQLKDIVHQTKVARHKRIHAQILLCLDENGPKLTELQASQACGVSTKTLQRLRKRCVLEGNGSRRQQQTHRHCPPQKTGW